VAPALQCATRWTIDRTCRRSDPNSFSLVLPAGFLYAVADRVCSATAV
jgi:hypothetical protein